MFSEMYHHTPIAFKEPAPIRTTPNPLHPGAPADLTPALRVVDRPPGASEFLSAPGGLPPPPAPVPSSTTKSKHLKTSAGVGLAAFVLAKLGLDATSAQSLAVGLFAGGGTYYLLESQSHKENAYY